MSAVDLSRVEPAPAPEIRFDHVSKVFSHRGHANRVRAIDDLSLEIRTGELVAILGKTGCGKSTMFNMIAGLLAPSAGKIEVCGHDPFTEFDWFRGKIAIVFQNDRLLPWRTAVDNVEVGLEMLDAPKTERRATAQEWLMRLGLAGYERAYPHTLSGGMRQRVAIARAFATNAGLLLCDEPFSALDEMTGNRLREEFSRLVRENGKTAVFITHSIDEALQIGDRIVVLRPPAQIAYDIKLTRDAEPAQKDTIKAAIRDVLSM